MIAGTLMTRRIVWWGICPILVFASVVNGGTITILPANNGQLGGTLVDGGQYGPFDGVADQSDWTFNGIGGFEGVLTLSPSALPRPLEQRVVWEFDLSELTTIAPTTVVLAFSLRGPPIYPFPDVVVEVYAYDADLQEQSSDFGAEPTAFLGEVTIAPFSEYLVQLNITEGIVETLRAGHESLGLRFQAASLQPGGEAQVFMDTVDSDDSTKPRLVVLGSPLGDDDGNAQIDLDDFIRLPSCVSGPNVTPIGTCLIYDFDLDRDVDQDDVARFIAIHSLFLSE